MRREKETTLQTTGVLTSALMPVHHTGVECVSPRRCGEVDESLCGLCSLWKLWHGSSAGIW